jgi:hypothetical protein
LPDFHRVKAPVFSPTMCLTCSTHQHPDGFVDTGVDLNPPHGRAYLCAGCVYQLARAVGCLSPAEAQKLRERIDVLNAEAESLVVALEDERDNKTVSVTDLLTMFEQAKQARKNAPPEMAYQPPSNGADSNVLPGLCSATKLNGAPCTAKALPGRDVCVAHSKQTVTVPVAGLDPDAEVD